MFRFLNISIERKFDKILKILYNKENLHWHDVPATNFIAFANHNYGLNWTDQQMNFVLTFLQEEGYIRIHTIGGNDNPVPVYSLTVKGVQMIRNRGGFTADKIISNVKNFGTISLSV